jgi:NADH-quinone oxidoreductase subunit C
MSTRLDTLETSLRAVLGAGLRQLVRARGEISVTVDAHDYLAAARTLRDHPELKFEQLLDLCGVDYSTYRNQPWEGPRYCVVSHLLSVHHNWRLRLKVFAPDNDLPVVASVNEVWNSANWFTDYGFIGHPMRKDFPVYGHVEMRYDDEKKRVIYQPVTIEPREITPRIVREDQYGGLN